MKAEHHGSGGKHSFPAADPESELFASLQSRLLTDSTQDNTDPPFSSHSPVGPDDPPLEEIAENLIEAEVEAGGIIRSGKLAGKTMWAAIWILAVPVLLQQTMAACVGMADKMIAGDLPDSIVTPAFDAIAIGSYIGWFIGIAMTGLGIGGQALIARAMGAGDGPLAHRSLGQAMALSVVWGGVVGVLLWGMAPVIAQLVGLSDEAQVFCVQYVRVISIGMPACGVMMVGGMCLHGAGETTLPSIIAIGVNIVNVVASFFLSGVDIEYGEFVLHNPSPIDPAVHGVTGIAGGTALSFMFGGICTLLVLLRGVKDLRLRAAEIRPDRSMMKRIVRIGVPNFMEGISMWSVNLFVLLFIGIIARRMGSGGEAEEGLQGAHIIAVQWEAFSFMPGFAIGTAAGALAGQYLGAGNAKMAKRAVIACTGLAAVVMTLLGIVFMLFGNELTRLISDEPMHLEHTPKLLFICGGVQVFFAITMVVRQGLRGVGDTKWTFIITTASSYGVRLPMAYVLGVMMGLGLEGVWYALCGEFVVRATLFCARFAHGGWKRVKV